MNCDKVVKALSLLLYGELTFEEEEAVHQHLEECGNCRQALERERSMHRALDEAELPVPADLLVECRRELRQRLGQAGARRGLLGRLWDWMGQPVPTGFAARGRVGPGVPGFCGRAAHHTENSGRRGTGGHAGSLPRTHRAGERAGRGG